MKRRIQYLIMSATVIMLWTHVHARGIYLNRLPSHKQCETCHTTSDGSGPQKAFSLAFFEQGRQWNESLCHLDSDGRWRVTFHKYMAYLQEHIAGPSTSTLLAGGWLPVYLTTNRHGAPPARQKSRGAPDPTCCETCSDWWEREVTDT